MIICVCKGISDRQIRGAIARGITTYEALSKEFESMGEICGICQGVVRELLGPVGVRRQTAQGAPDTVAGDACGEKHNH